MLHQKLSLSLPVLPLSCRDPCFSFLEKCSGKVSRSSREFHPLKTALDEIVTVQNDNRSSSNKKRENVPIFLRQFRKRFAEISHINVEQRSQ